MLARRPNNNRGFTLTELMVGSTIGLIVLSGAIQLYSVNIRASNHNLQLSRLSHDVRSLLSLMQRDIMRSGYWAFSPESSSSRLNPFTRQPQYLAIGNRDDETDDSCLLYSYDRYPDGLIGVGRRGPSSPATTRDNVEQFGFRLSDNRLQMRQGGRNYSCKRGRWQTMNEPSLSIDSLSFTPVTDCIAHAEKPGSTCEAGEPAWVHTRIQVSLTASAASDPDIRQTQSTTIDIRNDQWVAAW